MTESTNARHVEIAEDSRTAAATVQSQPQRRHDPEQLALVDAYWRAANYLSVGQIYLLDNPLLDEPLAPEHIKPRLLGHWGTTPGLNLLYAHVNRTIKERDLDVLYVTGPGHGGPGLVANAYLDGTYTEVYSAIGQDKDGMRALFRQFSFPGGIPSHVAPETPGSIHEGGELGYALVHAYGAVFDNPDLLALCVVGDGEAETGPLAASWHSNKFLNPVRDGAVLPVLHLNGYKIANPTVLARIPETELAELMRGYGYAPHFVSGDDPMAVHAELAATLDTVLDDIARIQHDARTGSGHDRPIWPMIVLRTPKGWTGPKIVDGLPSRAPGAPTRCRCSRPAPTPNTAPSSSSGCAATARRNSSMRRAGWCRTAGTRARRGAPHEREPACKRRAAARGPGHAGFPELRRPGRAPAAGTQRSRPESSALPARHHHRQPRLVPAHGAGRDRSNRLTPVFEETDRAWDAETLPGDDHLAPDGRVMEVLSEHLCQGWLEGYLLTGRHGLFNCYEAFIHIIDSMFNQHAKWLKTTRTIPWRAPIASLNYLLSSTCGARTTTGSPTRIPASSTTSSTRSPTSCASTCRRTPTPCCRSPTTACAVATMSTSSLPASSPPSPT